MILIKINETLYPATVGGRMTDKDWDDRASKTITLEMEYATANELFVNGLSWSIVEQDEMPVYTEDGDYAYDENGEKLKEIHEIEWDNSEYNLAGDLTDHRNGTITAKMGKLTDLEEAYEILLGGM